MGSRTVDVVSGDLNYTLLSDPALLSLNQLSQKGWAFHSLPVRS